MENGEGEGEGDWENGEWILEYGNSHWGMEN